MKENKSTISKMVLEKIKKDEVKLIPKWHFILRYGFLWIIIILFLLCASMALGVIFFEISDIDWEITPLLGMSVMHYLFWVLPYFWLVIFIGIGVLAYFNFMATPKGYKYPKYQVIIFGISILIMIASTFHYFGTTSMIRDTLRERIPGFHRLMNGKEDIWSRPDDGLLAGKIIEIQENGIIVVAFDEKEWNVDTSKANIPNGKQLDEGQMVRIIGKKTGENNFVADKIKPWKKNESLNFGDNFPPKNMPDDHPGPPPINDKPIPNF
jgi:hypothetical protein